ncbi:MAG: hypothetical protein AABX85_01730 [Nanoarchaeota archaeon]
MNVLSFNFTKISAERKLPFKHKSIRTNIEFINIEKDEIEMLKDSEVIKISFNFVVDYSESKEKEESKEPTGKIIFEGVVILSADKEESKEILEAWKNKKLPETTKAALFNLILKKCSIKALSLEEELNLPYHLPLPNIKKTPQKE